MVGKRSYAPTGSSSKRRKTTPRVRYNVPRAYPSRSNIMVAARRRSGRMGRSANYVDAALATYQCNTTGSVGLLNTVAVGANQSQRTGKKIYMKSIQIRGVVISGSTTTVSQAAFMLVYDRRPGGALPAITDILTSVSPNAMLNDAASARFRVLYRWSGVNVGNSATAGQLTDKTAYNIDTYYKFKGKYGRVSYAGAGTGAIGDIDEGALYIVAVGANVSGNADSDAQLAFRLRYYDVQG